MLAGCVQRPELVCIGRLSRPTAGRRQRTGQGGRDAPSREPPTSRRMSRCRRAWAGRCGYPSQSRGGFATLAKRCTKRRTRTGSALPPGPASNGRRPRGRTPAAVVQECVAASPVRPRTGRRACLVSWTSAASSGRPGAACSRHGLSTATHSVAARPPPGARPPAADEFPGRVESRAIGWPCPVVALAHQFLPNPCSIVSEVRRRRNG
jgi:hypothetical protein